MSNYFICVGGTGSRIGEAFVYLAATGYFGDGETKIWIVDKDTKCANGSFLHSAVSEYATVKSKCAWKDSKCFNHTLSLNEWNFDDALKALDPGATGDSPFKELGKSSRETQIVMNLLHDAESLDNSMSKGFYGRAQTGTALYKAIEQIPTFFAGDALFESIRLDISRGIRPTVFFAGSSFGATGASLLPNMAKTLRREFGAQVAIGAVLMLPYFGYEIDAESGSKALVSPETHWDKAKEALRYYGDANRMSIRKIGTPLRAAAEGATFDAFYISGCLPLKSINNQYADGGADQANDSHIAELYAAMGAKHFFDLAETGKESDADFGAPAVFAYELTDGAEFGWDHIDGNLRIPMLSLARYSVAVLTYLHPLSHQKSSLKKDDTFKKSFGTNGFLGAGDARIDETTVREHVTFAANFSKRFLDYVHRISFIGPKVSLFDTEYFSEVFTCLQEYAPKPANRLRSLTLCDEYDDEQRSEVYKHCQLYRVEFPKFAGALAVKETKVNQLATHIIDDMKMFKAASVAPNQYSEHTADGMRRVLQSIYDYCYDLK